MDDFDVFTSKPSTIQENDLFESGSTNEKTNHHKDDSSWSIENNSDSTTSFQLDENHLNSSTEVNQSDDILQNGTSSPTPITFNHDDDILQNGTSSPTPITLNYDDDVFQNHEQSNSIPPTVEEILSENKSSYDLFTNIDTSPLQAVIKKREEEIAAKDAEENRKIEELRQQAKTDLERWYKDRERQLEENRQTMKNNENDLRSKSLEKSSKELCDWSKVIRFLEFTDGTQVSKAKRDVTRMKSCMLTAKRINDNKKLANGT